MTKPILWAILVATVLTLPQTFRGPAILSDACGYLSVAKSLAEGKGPVNFGGWKDLAHPFGYPLALAPLIRIGLAPADAAALLNWLSLAGVFLLSWAILTRLATRTTKPSINSVDALTIPVEWDTRWDSPPIVRRHTDGPVVVYRPAAWLPLLGAGLATATPALFEAGQQGLSEAWFTLLGLAFVWAVMKGVEK